MKLKHTLKCELYQGSLLKLANEGGYLSLGMVDGFAHRLSKCPDRTAKENELLAALLKDIKESDS